MTVEYKVKNDEGMDFCYTGEETKEIFFARNLNNGEIIIPKESNLFKPLLLKVYNRLKDDCVFKSAIKLHKLAQELELDKEEVMGETNHDEIKQT